MLDRTIIWIISSAVFIEISYSFVSSPMSTYWASDCVPGPVLGSRDMRTPKIQSPFSQRSQALWGTADQYSACLRSILLGEGGGILNVIHVPNSILRRSSLEKWLLISSEGFLLRGKYFQFVLAEYWPVYTVFPSTAIPFQEVVIDQNETN